jgi:hypothetical protein
MKLKNIERIKICFHEAEEHRENKLTRLEGQRRQVLIACGRLDITPTTTTRSALIVRY